MNMRAILFALIILASPAMGDDRQVQDDIAKSIASFPGPCPCPYSKDANGKLCGDRSEYRKTVHQFGYVPFCYPSDLAPDDKRMIITQPGSPI